MKIVAIGGRGPVGSKLVTNLDAQGHEAIAVGVDTFTAEVLEHASVVIDVSSAPSL